MTDVGKAQEIQHEEFAPPATLQMADQAEIKSTYEVDTVHHDEALKVLANYNGQQTWDEKEETRLTRKIDRRLLPILCITYALQYYDKGMISLAALFGIIKDLDLSGNRYSMSSSIFYLGFIAGAYPASQLAQRYPVERVAGGLVLVWGITFILTSVCYSWQAFYAQRFFLGFIEAGVSPIFMLVVGQFYKKDEQIFRMGVWFSASGYVSTVGVLLNYGLAHISSKTSLWRYMYVVGGGLTIIWSFVVLFFMPPDPIRAKGLNERERYIAVARLRVNNAGVRNLHFKKEQVLEVLVDEKFWIILAMGFLCMIAAGPANAFVPLIVSGFGFNLYDTLLLLVPLGITSGSIILGATYVSYKFPRVRTYVFFVCELITMTSALLLWLLPSHSRGGLLVGCYILPGFSGAWGVLMGLLIGNAAGYTKRVFSSSAIYLGYCLGQFTGPLLFKPKDAPRYGPAFKIIIITAALSAGLSMVYRLVCIWENKRRDNTGIMEAFEHAYEDDVTDKKNPQFRYLY